MAQGRGDPARVAAQILPGVGFIGAGTILHLRGSVTGLTSAATIWVVAAIGMSLGARAYLEALGTTFVVMVVLAGLGRAEALIGRQAARSRLLIHARPGPTTLEDLQELVRISGWKSSTPRRGLRTPTWSWSSTSWGPDGSTTRS